MNRSNQRNYDVKKQTKIDNRQNKYTKKSALRHQDDANRLYVQKKRILQRRQQGIQFGAQDRKKELWENVKYLIVVFLCVGVIVFFGFRLLQKKAESQVQTDF